MFIDDFFSFKALVSCMPMWAYHGLTRLTNVQQPSKVCLFFYDFMQLGFSLIKLNAMIKKRAGFFHSIVECTFAVANYSTRGEISLLLSEKRKATMEV